jgi:hypothetical protein
MRIINIIRYSAVGLILGTACATPRGGEGVVEPSPSPMPSVEAPVSETKGASRGPWSFRYAPGTYTYSIITEAQVAQLPDTTNFRAIPATTQMATVAVTDTGVVVIDPATPETLQCDPSAALFTRAQVLLPQLPSYELSAGATWNDSTTSNGCRGTIPTTTTVVRTFTVVGDTTYDATSALHIKRTETIVAKGEGNEGQHRIVLSATGSGSTDIYLDVATGRLLGVTSQQTTQVGITTSGRVSEFLQKVTERVTLAP